MLVVEFEQWRYLLQGKGVVRKMGNLFCLVSCFCDGRGRGHGGLNLFTIEYGKGAEYTHYGVQDGFVFFFPFLVVLVLVLAWVLAQTQTERGFHTHVTSSRMKVFDVYVQRIRYHGK